MDTIARSCICCALIFCTLFRKYSGEKWLRLCVGAALASWFGVVLWMTVLGRIPDVGYEAHWIPLHTYWAVFFGADQEMLRSCFLNVILFYPAGLLLAGLIPESWSFRKGLLCTISVFALFSLAIELSQYFRELGNCEIDDVLHNTLGAGWALLPSVLMWTAPQERTDNNIGDNAYEKDHACLRNASRSD